MPSDVAKAWIKSFQKEISGIIVQRRACALEDPLPSDPIVPLHTVFRCKITKDGLIDKLKTRVVFRGDLHNPAEPMDPWNPHASFLTLKIFLANCARRGTYPRQVDFLLAYLQADMRERVFIKFPESWKRYLPEHLHKWMGRAVLLKKALYGYNYSGKFLYQDQSEFLEREGFEEVALGYWIKRLPGDKTIEYLHYVDDILSTSDNEVEHQKFLARLAERFDVDIKPRADWYLQTRIQQDSDGNITLDQARYAKSMVQRFLPNYAGQAPSKKDLQRFRLPVKFDARLFKEDCAKSKEEVESLEREYGFRYIELIGCFNWLSYTCVEETFGIRRLCRFMSKPGRPHFQAALHMLHHFRCHPPKPLIFCRDAKQAPIAKMLEDVEDFEGFDPTHVVFADSAHADSDERRSTACDMHFYQGGVIDHISWVPNPIPLSTAESENNCYSAAVMRASYVTKILCKLWCDNADASYTVPICVDSSAAKAMNESDCPSRKTRHVESRYWFGKLARQQGRVRYVKVDGDTQQPADIGTKNVLWDKTNHYLPMIEAAKSPDE